MVNSIDGVPNICRVVETDVVVDSRGEILAHFFESCVYAVCGVERVGARQLVHCNRDRRLAV